MQIRVEQISYSVFLHPALFLQPENAVAGPGMPFGGVIFAAAEAQAVLPFFIDVQVERNASLAQRGGELEAVFDRDGFVFIGVPNEAGRSVFFDLEFI